MIDPRDFYYLLLQTPRRIFFATLDRRSENDAACIFIWLMVTIGHRDASRKGTRAEWGEGGWGNRRIPRNCNATNGMEWWYFIWRVRMVYTEYRERTALCPSLQETDRCILEKLQISTLGPEKDTILSSLSHNSRMDSLFLFLLCSTLVLFFYLLYNRTCKNFLNIWIYLWIEQK